MSAQIILDRLNKYKSVGDGKWVARCPSHEDSTPSLSITEKSDGRILIHCFGGCGALEVLASIGLGWDALYPEDEHYPAKIKRVSDVLEDFVVEFVEHARETGQSISAQDKVTYLAALKKGGKRNGFVWKVATEIAKNEH